jgi:hypothetical protein
VFRGQWADDQEDLDGFGERGEGFGISGMESPDPVAALGLRRTGGAPVGSAVLKKPAAIFYRAGSCAPARCSRGMARGRPISG